MQPGLYVFPCHHDCIEEIRRLQPSCVKGFAGVTSNDWWRSVHQVAPGAIRVLVHGEISDNNNLLPHANGAIVFAEGEASRCLLRRSRNSWQQRGRRSIRCT